MPERAPSLRRLTQLTLVGFGILAVLVATGLVWTSTLLERSLVTAVRDVQSRAVASELELSLLTYQRLRNLYVLTGQEVLEDEAVALADRMHELVEQAIRHVGSDAEAKLIAEVGTELDAYLVERRRLERSGIESAEVVRRSQSSLNTCLETLEALGALNDAQVEAATARALQVDDLSNLVGLTAGGLIVLGLAAVAVAIRSQVLQPMFALHNGISRFEAGRIEARVPVRGPRELTDLARGFNDMAERLSQQREAQLTFLAGVAHDLRNPLSGLKLGIYALEREQSEAGRRRAREALDRQIQRLGRMVDDLLDAARIEAGNLELRVERVDLHDVVGDVVRLYGPTTDEHELIVEAPSTPVMVDADPVRLEQVLGNLVSNAIKFSPGGGPIRVRLGIEDDCAVLSVEDQGVGIPEEELPTIFLPFRRRRPDLAPGAGLGLSVVRRIVEAHGGRIEVQSRPGRGTTFRVILPRGEEERWTGSTTTTSTTSG